MIEIRNNKADRVFKYFEEISTIPRGSGNMEGISNYCTEFAKKHSLEVCRDEANNVIIYKKASKGYENAEPIILQGHLDMVCQKTENSDIDFEKDGIKIYTDGDYIKAENTTLGADNGIAIAMIMAILESDKYLHPAIEAVFTTDEETGMIGAGKLCFDKIKGKKMINIDSEDPEILTVSCAGGRDFVMTLPYKEKNVTANEVTIKLKGLKGGHSGVEIDGGRVNADILAGRVLHHLSKTQNFDIISISGGDKGNAIPNICTINLAVSDTNSFIGELNQYAEIIKNEIKEREPDFIIEAEAGDKKVLNVMEERAKIRLISMLITVPNGVIEMSAEIKGLVETSLNLGILNTDDEKILMHYTLRSNKNSALDFLKDRLFEIADIQGFQSESFGYYPPWEYNTNSELQKIYKETYKESFGYEPKVEAIHAGLECGLFASDIDGFDCISIGPEMHDIHTVNERLSITSTENIFSLLLNVLKKCK